MKKAQLRSAVTLVAASASLLACSASPVPSDASVSATGSPHLVHASAKVQLGHTKPADNLASLSMVEINGMYGPGCLDASGPWSVAVNGSDTALDFPALAVVQANFACELSITSVRADQLYVASSPLPLGFGPAIQGVAFAPDGDPGDTSFYLNGWNMDPGYFGDFMLFLAYSDEPNDTTGSTNATYATSSAVGATVDLPSPDYGVDLSGVAIQTDANNTVMQAGGQVTLDFADTCGSAYVIDDGTLAPGATFGQIDAFFNSQQATPIDCGANFSVPTSGFSLQWSSLPAYRNVIVQANGLGTPTYQLIALTFNPPELT